MFTSSSLRVALFGAALVVSGCASAPETSRAVPGIGLETNSNASAIVGAVHRMQPPRSVLVINFAFDSDRLDARAMSKLNRQAEWIEATPNARFSVTGHTDKVGDTAYNADLGLRRAKAALAYLVTRGIDEDRLVAMVSEGELHPVVNTEEREILNRRVETAILSYDYGTQDVGAGVAGSQANANVFKTASSEGAATNNPSGVEPGEAGPSGSPSGPSEVGSGGSNQGSASDSSVSTSGGSASSGTKNNGGDATSPGSPGGSSTQQTNNNGKGKGQGSQMNAGKGNGAEGGDPGNSAGRNKGGDLD